MNFSELEVLHRTVCEMENAAHGAKQAIVERCAQTLGLSVKRVYTLLREHRAEMGQKRERRADANVSNVTLEELTFISGLLAESRRANGKRVWSIARAIDVLRADGKIATPLSAARISTLLHRHCLHPEQLAQPSPSIRMRTEHPNAVFQIDASVCVLYKTPRGEIEVMEREAFYKNKLHNVAKVMNDLVVRYVGTDHASGSIGTQFYVGGETTENALNFVMWLVTQRMQGAAPLPFHGVPFTLYTDQGSAFKSGPFVNYCRAMRIELLHHAPRNSRATGQVENAQNLVERGLEGVFRFLDSASLTLDRMNALAEQWMTMFNGTRRHSRHGMTRYGAWSLITTDQLRIAPSLEVMRSLAISQAEPRTVTNDMKITFVPVRSQGSRTYDVRYVPGLCPAAKVMVAINPYRLPAVDVGITDQATGEIVWHTVEPVERDRFGFDVTAPVLGASYQAMPNTIADDHRNAIARAAYATEAGPATLEQADAAKRGKKAPYLGQFNPLADIEAAKVPAYLPKRGTALDAPVRTVEAQRLSTMEACKRLRTSLGDAYTPEVYGWVASRWPDGVPEDQLDAIAAQFAPREQSATAAGLRVVGGAQ